MKSRHKVSRNGSYNSKQTQIWAIIQDKAKGRRWKEMVSTLVMHSSGISFAIAWTSTLIIYLLALSISFYCISIYWI